MADACIPVDLFNPGQVFACIGLVEAADILLGDARGAFDWSESGNPRFCVRAKGDESPVARVLRFLDGARACAEAPRGSAAADAWIGAWGPAPRSITPERGYPFPDPSSPATFVCVLSDGTHELRLDHWGDHTRRDNVKFWAGAGGYPGAALARDALELVHGKALGAVHDPFALSLPQSSSFRLDWRRDYIPIHLGFSLNAHGSTKMMGFPLVELLGAIGLTHARPRRPSWSDKLVYTYAVIGRDLREPELWLRPNILRAALGGAPFPFPTRHFRMLLDWPGKEGQDRSITTVTEETAA